MLYYLIVFKTCSVFSLWAVLTERFRGEVFTMGRYTNLIWELSGGGAEDAWEMRSSLPDVMRDFVGHTK